MPGRRVLLALAVCLVTVNPPAAQSKTYAPKNGVLNWKAILLGGAFRVTIAVPLHGDFSQFDRVEIVRAESLIGRDAPAGFLRQLTRQLADEFSRVGTFAEVAIVDGYDSHVAHPLAAADAAETFRSADSLDAPIRPAADLAVMDRERQAAARATPSDTLVVTSDVIDYAKGNKLAQLLFLNFGNSVVTLRLSYFDKATGDELGRSVISSDNSSKVVPSLLSPRTALTGVAEGLVDQITRRKVAAEQ